MTLFFRVLYLERFFFRSYSFFRELLVKTVQKMVRAPPPNPAKIIRILKSYTIFMNDTVYSCVYLLLAENP